MQRLRPNCGCSKEASPELQARTSDSSDGGYTGQVLVTWMEQSEIRDNTDTGRRSVYFCPEQDGDRGDLTRIALRFIQATTLNFACDFPVDVWHRGAL